MKMLALRLAILAALLLVMPSCKHKPLCEFHPHQAKVKVVFDWRDAPTANPKGMCVFFYPEDGGTTRRYDFKGMEGGYVDLSVGRYRVIAYNNDTEYVDFAYTDAYERHLIFSPTNDIFSPLGLTSSGYIPRADDTERVVSRPDMMWACSAVEVDVKENGITYIHNEVSRATEVNNSATVERIITLYPHQIVATYTLNVKNCDGLEYVTQMCGSLSGMAPNITVSSEALGAECVTVPYECRKKDETTIEAVFLTFGHNTDNTQPHRVVLYLWMTDNKIRCYGIDSEKFDVTSQVHSAPDRLNVYLEIDGLDLPKPISGGSGFIPDVDDWIDVETDLDMSN